MTNEVVVHDADLLNVLRNSLYPGAQDASIRLVVGYCKAAGFDPMHKPVHIVPMWDSKAGEMRDVIMPGIGSYRVQASRSGQYAGSSDPEYGPDVVDENIGGVKITYPSWCRVTVKRLLANGAVAEFSATERWKENYAMKGGKEKSIAPNAMWRKRPYAQLAKCAEAQALRKAFPEVGAQPTADEMEGKALDDEDYIQPKATIEMPVAIAQTRLPPDTIPATIIPDATPNQPPIADEPLAEPGEKMFIEKKLFALKQTDPDAIMQSVGITSLDGLTKQSFKALQAALKGKK